MIRRMRPTSMTVHTVHDAVVAELHTLYPKFAPAITAKTHLYDDLGMDSLDAVELALALEDRFGIEIGNDYLREVETVGTLVKKVEGMK